MCPQDGMPSVSSINRIVRNKVVERVCKSEYEDLEPLLDTKHKLAPSSYSINRILGQHAHLSPAPALKRKWSEDAKAAADSGSKYGARTPAASPPQPWRSSGTRTRPTSSSRLPPPRRTTALCRRCRRCPRPCSRASTPSSTRAGPPRPRPAWTPPWASSPPCRSSRRSHRSTQRTKTHLLTQVPSCNQSIKSKYFSTFICCIHVKTF